MDDDFGPGITQRPVTAGGDRRLKLRLFLLSFLMLFTELALIRWTGENVVYLSYFANFVLLGSFLGIGLGFLRARARSNGFTWAPMLLAGLVLLVGLFPIEIDRTGSELLYFGSYEPTGPPIWVILPLIFLAVAAVMMSIAEGVAATFVRFQPLDAYRLDIAGSVAGSVAFAAFSFLRAPPVVWGVVVCLLLLLLLEEVRWFHVAAALAVFGILTFQSFKPLDTWSPYYRITVTPSGNAHWIEVNGILHQGIKRMEDRREAEPFYFVPYELIDTQRLGEVLVVGAGSGTDVAVALSLGAAHVDAVEIDPRIYELGTELNPDRPYQDPRVDIHIDDGRAFMEQAEGHYDLIVFALPDSLTLVSGQSSLRLESYLFTQEALDRASELLAPGGVFVMYNYYREPWLIDRLAATLDRAFSVSPCVQRIGVSSGLAVLVATNDPGAVICPGASWSQTEATPLPVQDDYPFVYLRRPGVPGFYLLTLGLILAASALLIRATAGPLSGMRPYLDLFFMGAAFLLLETKNVIQFALLFGTTWFVNALVFVGILLAVLGAVELARAVTLPRPEILYIALFASLGIAYLFPSRTLLLLDPPLRFLLATVLAFAPIFLANLVFAQRFRGVASSVVAFGANLLGAMIGGVLEYLSLVTGYRTLLIIAAVLYAMAFFTGHRYLKAPSEAKGEEVANQTPEMKPAPA